jgi:hypothetical protein
MGMAPSILHPGQQQNLAIKHGRSWIKHRVNRIRPLLRSKDRIGRMSLEQFPKTVVDIFEPCLILTDAGIHEENLLPIA